MKFIYDLDLGEGEMIAVVATTGENADPAEALMDTVPVGQPFLAFGSLPAEIEGSPAWDKTGAPVCSADIEANRSAINAMIANPPLSKVRVA
jgi:hypothetical protein